METSIERIPTYRLGYLVNGDMTGLTKQEINNVEDLLREQKVELVCLPSSDENWEPYFSSSPWIGLPTEVVDCTIVYRVT